MMDRNLYKWLVVAVLWWVCFLNYADRQLIFTVFPLLAREFKLSDVSLSVVSASFMCTYAVVGPVAGLVCDRVPRRLLILGALILWSVTAAATAFAHSYAQLVAGVALGGFAEAFYFPAAMSMIADYHAADTRSRAMALHQSSVYVGSIAGGAIAGYLGQYYGWRAGFRWFGIVGILVGAALWLVVKEPQRGLSDQMAGKLPAGNRLPEVLRELAGNRIAWVLVAVFMGANFVAMIFTVWLPTFLFRQFHLSLSMSGLSGAAFLQIASVLGVLCGGALADHRVKHSRGGRGARMQVQALGLFCGVPFLFISGWTTAVSFVLGAMIGFGFFKGIYDSNLWAALYDVTPIESRGAALGIMNSLGWLGGAIAQLGIGLASERFGMGTCLSATAAVYLFIAVAMSLGAGKLRRQSATARLSSLSILLCGIVFSLQIARPSPLWGQDALDPARDPSHLSGLAGRDKLPEQYIWTQEEAHTAASTSDAIEWLFQRTFTLNAVPRRATLYVAASGDVEVWLNGIRLLTYTDDRTLRAGYTVHAMDAASSLRAGDNAIAICVRNLHGTHHTTTDREMLQFIGGRAIAVKLLPAERGTEAVPLLISDSAWQAKESTGSAGSSEDALQLAAAARFDATAWPAVESLGSIEGNTDFFQWNADAGMYAWPGYVGASPFLKHYALRPVRLLHVYAGSATVEHQEQLTGSAAQDGNLFTVELSPHSAQEESPALTIDFGREVAGRIHFQSAADGPILVSTAYGESEEEALHEPFLGDRTVYIPPHGDAWGPKSAFRFVRLRFLTDARFAAIDLDGIAYPVQYEGAFASSDAELNRIWETAAYTAHLCMQDGLWDGVKRDRARWAGDIDVSGRVINDVFADRSMLEDTLTRLIDETDGARAVNGITGYSALWVSSVAEFYRHSGDREFLLQMHPRLLDLLKTMDRDIDADGVFAPLRGEHVFVDWAPGLSTDTPEARHATDFEYLLAYKEAAWLLTEMDDRQAAMRYKDRYDTLRRSAREHLMNKAEGTFGDSWQTNSMAVLSGSASQAEYPALWSRVFANIDQVTAGSPVITPYYGYYVLRAMAMLGHRTEALHWMRDFWGGMLAEGATSFWESYDPRWTKRNFHTGLQADGLAGYYVSLAHGWSSGPAAWLMDELLGVQPTGAGFRTAVIDPETAGLKWIDGAVPTPNGIIHVHVQGNAIALNLPEGVAATVLVKATDTSRVALNGVPVQTRATDMRAYRSLEIDRAGHYDIVSK